MLVQCFELSFLLLLLSLLELCTERHRLPTPAATTSRYQRETARLTRHAIGFGWFPSFMELMILLFSVRLLQLCAFNITKVNIDNREASGDFWEEEEWVRDEKQALRFFPPLASEVFCNILLYIYIGKKVIMAFNVCITP